MAQTISFSDMRQRFDATPGPVSMSSFRGRYDTSNGGGVSVPWNGFTPFNSPIFKTTGSVTNGPIVELTGAQLQYLNSTTPTTFNIETGGGFTAVCLVRFTGTPRPWERIIDWGNGQGGSTIWLGRNAASTQLNLQAFNNGMSFFLAAPSVIVQGQWAVFTVVLTNSSGTLDIYKNNVLVATRTGLPVFTNRAWTNTYVGKSNWNDPNTNMDIGCILGYDRALSGAELTTAYNYVMTAGGTLPATPVVLLQASQVDRSNVGGPVSMSSLFPEIGLNATLTSSWNGFTPFNGPIVTTTGGVTNGPMVQLTGTQSQYCASGSKTLNMGTGGGFTMVCLIRMTNTQWWERVLDWSDGPSRSAIAMGRIFGTSNMFIQVLGGEQLTATSIIIQNQWAVFTAVCTNSTGTLDLYKDNVLVATRTGVPAQPDRTFVDLFVGKSSFATDPSSNMDIGCILAYDRALTGPELTTAYNYVMTDGGTLPATPVILLQASQAKTPVASLWATRALSRRYTGPTVQVRRNADGALANVHSTMGGLVDKVVAGVGISATAVSSTGVMSNPGAVVYGNAVFQQTSPFPGYGSLSLPTSAYMEIPSLTGLAWTAQPFTMETWTYPVTTNAVCIGQYFGNAPVHSMSIGITNGLPYLRYWSQAAGDITLIGNTVMAANVWHHLAMCSEAVVGNTANVYLYCNGIRQTLTGAGASGTYGILTTPATFGYPFTIGRGFNQASTLNIQGARVLLGNMAYTTSTFTPGLLTNGPSNANTALLLNMPTGITTSGPTSLVNWLAGNVGYVRVWYDQMGTKHLTETLAVNQPVFDTDTNSVYINNVTGNVFTSNVGLSYGEAFSVTDATFAVNIIPMTFASAQFNNTGWFGQDPIIGGERPGIVDNDFALAMQDGTKLGFGGGADSFAPTVNTGVTDGFGVRNVMAVTRASGTGVVRTFKDGVSVATGTRGTGNVFGSTPTSIGRCTTGAVSKLNAKMLALVHSTTALSNASVAFLSYAIGN